MMASQESAAPQSDTIIRLVDKKNINKKKESRS